jgi:hypothetical protein
LAERKVAVAELRISSSSLRSGCRARDLAPAAQASSGTPACRP